MGFDSQGTEIRQFCQKTELSNPERPANDYFLGKSRSVHDVRFEKTVLTFAICDSSTSPVLAVACLRIVNMTLSELALCIPSTTDVVMS